MKLYFSPGACSLSCHISLREAGIPFELEKVDIREHKTADGGDFYAINPKGYVPALRLDDGNILTENAAINQYVADQKPEMHLAPPAGTVERARLQEWLSFTGGEIHKSFGPLFRPDTPDATKKSSLEKLGKHFAYVDQKLTGKQYLLGDQFTVADSYLFVMLTWADNMKIDLTPTIRAYKDRIAARPAVKIALEAEQAARNAAAAPAARH